MRGLYSGLRIFWGDSHLNVHGEDIFFPPLTSERLDRIFEEAKRHLDFLMIAYYPFKWYSKKGFVFESKGPAGQFIEEWRLIQEAVAKWNKPGEFVTFLGYEWPGDRKRYGDHNVYYLKDYEPLDYSESLLELYRRLKSTDAIVIPHHTAYRVGERGKDWNYFDEDLTPFVEVYSSHGSSEGLHGLPFLDRIPAMGPSSLEGSVLEGLNRGYKFGIIASGDNHADYAGVWGNGLMAVFAEELTREALWKAFKMRRVYGVTGDRIKLYFSINNHIIGDCFRIRSQPTITFEAVGSEAIDRIEVIRNGRVVHVYSHLTSHNRLEERKEVIRVKLRIICGWGPGEPYKFKKIEPKKWVGHLSVSDGRIVSVEPCFTYFGQRIRRVSEKRYDFAFLTQPRYPLNPLLALHHQSNFQGAVFELEAPLRSIIEIRVNSETLKFRVEEALMMDRIIAFSEEAEKLLYEQFEISSKEINPDVYWHNSWKMKICKAVPEEEYRARFNWIDEKFDEFSGSSAYYYVRVIQVNGQMAWSSPIWVKKVY